ncbi:AfsA-related hotdog domain-containing protein [Leptospira sp. 96542]|nr:AfsA-related hotdog domain-containing protein [Leptospira sp. 96542]
MNITIDEELPSVIPLSKQYTRTYFQDDSFVSNIRRALPRLIPAEIMEGFGFPKLDPKQINFFLQYYELKGDNSGKYYLLKTVPSRVSRETADRLLSEADLEPTQREFLNSLYEFDSSFDKFVLKSNITEAEEIRILQMFKRKDYYIGNVEKSALSSILEPITEIPKKDVFFANLYIPPNHQFFSPPNLKHISGMQIVEAARQFGIACNHLYGKVPFEDVTFLLLHLNSEFLQYAKINMPIKMRTVCKEVKYSKAGYWNFSSLDITVYQENQEITKIQMAANILPLKVYKRLKNTQEEVYEIDPRFRVLERFKNNLSIRHEGKKFVFTIENISMSGFMAKSSGEFPHDLLGREGIEFFMHFDLAGFVHGSCKMLWFKEDPGNEDQFFVGFQFESLSKLDTENIKETINRYGRLIEDREIQ